jgi:cell division septation protein DedD
MNRIITILVTIFILLLLYIWISHVWGSDNPRRPKPIVDATEHDLMDDGEPFDTTSTLSTNLLDDAPATADGEADNVGNSVTEDDDESTSTNEFNTERTVTQKTPVTTPKQEVTKPVEPKKEEKQAKPAPKTEAPPKTTNTTKTSDNAPATSKPAATQTKTTTSTPAKTVSAPASTDTGGKHLVIAGNFSQKANADQRVSELKKAGFSEAEVVNFDLSEYHTVCAGRFADVNEARKLVKKLKDYHKIDAYVRIGS